MPKGVRVGDDRHRPGLPRQPDRLFRGEPGPPDVRRLPRCQPELERLLDGLDVALSHHDCGDVGPADAAGASLFEDLLHRHRHPELGQPVCHQLVATVSAQAQLFQTVLKRPRAGAQPENDEMHPTLVVFEGKLGARDQLEAGSGRCRGGVGDAVQGVVIGQGEGVSPTSSACSTRAAGFSEPSDAVEWEWRSTAMGLLHPDDGWCDRQEPVTSMVTVSM